MNRVSISEAETTLQQTVHALYRHHHGWLHGWLRKRLGCSEQAADLAQDTFLRMLGRRHQPVGLRQPRAYLATIARGLLINHWQRLELERAWLETLAALPPALAPSLEEQHLAREALYQIARLLDGLPPRTSEIFLLSQLDGLSYPRIAQRLGVSVNIVQKAMLSAVRHCRRALA
jgi:RNA polymerase sigma-70 factor (ECF subfamily)